MQGADGGADLKQILGYSDCSHGVLSRAVFGLGAFLSGNEGLDMKLMLCVDAIVLVGHVVRLVSGVLELLERYENV